MDNRQILRAKRNSESFADSRKQIPSTSGRNNGAPRGMSAEYYRENPAGSKNIAFERMKRLRETLADDLNKLSPEKRDAEDYPPPKKRFAREDAHASHSKPNLPPSSVSADGSTRLRTQSSMNHRLKGAVAVTSVPQRSRPYSRLPNRQNSCERVHHHYANAHHSSNRNHTVTSSQPVANNNVYRATAPAPTVVATTTPATTLHSNLNVNPGSSLDDVEMSMGMDWSPITEESLLSDLRVARNILYEQQVQVQLTKVKKTSPASSLGMNAAHVYVVVDTNIFIDKLQTIINIMHIVYSDDSFPVIYVPWMVIQELDYFKDGYSLSEQHPISKTIQARCRKAVKFINDCLIARKHNFKGQPVQKAAESRPTTQSADDSILLCCMQLHNEGYQVVLLSSDTNLRNKALISEIVSYSPLEIINELKIKKTAKKTLDFVGEISKKLSLICSFVLHFEIKNYFGQKVYDEKGFKDLPWLFRDCVQYMKNYYDEVFQLRLQKQCRKVIDDLHEFLFVNEAVVNEVKFMELSLSLLIYLQSGLPKYDSNIQIAIQEIKQLEDEFLH